jgi:hypothetical protein
LSTLCKLETEKKDTNIVNILLFYILVVETTPRNTVQFELHFIDEIKSRLCPSRFPVSSSVLGAGAVSHPPLEVGLEIRDSIQRKLTLKTAQI